MITSKDNQIVKYIKSLSQKKYRDIHKEYIVEGIKMVLEALESNEEISKIIICEELLKDELQSNLNLKKVLEDKGEICEYVSRNIFEYISDTITPQGILILVKEKKELDYSSNIIFALDNLQDPGNLGTIIRTLDSAGYKDLILSNGTAEAYNSKVIRSTMGAIFRINLHKDKDLYLEIDKLKNKGYKVVVTSLDTSNYFYDLNFNEKLVIVIGNESKGVSKELQDFSDIKVKIPMIGKTESLNAAVATSIIAYEGVRQNLYRKG